MAALPARPESSLVAAPADEIWRERMQAAIAAKASRFTLGALLDALQTLGYRDEEIDFRSHASAAHQSSVIAAVHFSAAPPRRVTVLVNLGLLSAQSVLPSYFQRVLEQQVEGTLSGFLNFFAHRLLRDTARGQFPERDDALFPVWSLTLAQLRSLLGLRSLSTVHFLFEQIYPELGVAVQRTALMRTVRSRGVRMGPWALGDGAVLGAVTTLPVSGMAIRLFSDEVLTGSGQPWAREAMRRLQERLFPLLTGHGLHLEVALVLRDQRSFMVLRSDQFLGYQPLRGSAGEEPSATGPLSRSVRTIILWSGEVPVVAA